MAIQIVELSDATPGERSRALDEVKDFASTDMGLGGVERWTYQLLPEPTLSEELIHLSNAQTQGRVDSVSFQPCRSYHCRSQDRYTVEEWSMPGGVWTFTAVFDGHMNHECVDCVAQRLPAIIKRSLESQLRSASSRPLPPDVISHVLSHAVVHLDESITSEFLELFPGGQRDLQRMNPGIIRQIINDKGSGGHRHRKAAQVFGGSTALLTLTDPSRQNLWVANLGDCHAVLGTKHSTGTWSGTLLNNIQNGGNPAELQRVRNEHPGEPECVKHGRIAGFLAPTRAIGDAWLKLPAVYTQRVLLNLDAEWVSQHSIEDSIPRILTPPYVSSRPEVFHHRLRHSSNSRAGGSTDAFLILCSDGLPDLREWGPTQDMVNSWARVVGREFDSSVLQGQPGHLALSLLRNSIGGDDAQLVSRTLTVEMEERWMDDITIVVQRL